MESTSSPEFTLLESATLAMVGEEEGTGFFIAEGGWALTAKHLARCDRCTIRYRGHTHTAIVKKRCPRHDVALLRVDGVGEHPCCGLGNHWERYDEVLGVGYPSDEFSSGPTAFRLRIDPDQALRPIEFEDGRVETVLWLYNPGRRDVGPTAGVSGGPVLRRSTLRVIGVMTGVPRDDPQRIDHRAAGYAVPLSEAAERWRLLRHLLVGNYQRLEPALDCVVDGWAGPVRRDLGRCVAASPEGRLWALRRSLTRRLQTVFDYPTVSLGVLTDGRLALRTLTVSDDLPYPGCRGETREGVAGSASVLVAQALERGCVAGDGHDLVVPLRTQGRVIGILWLTGPTKGWLGAEDRYVAQRVAELVGNLLRETEPPPPDELYPTVAVPPDGTQVRAGVNLVSNSLFALFVRERPDWRPNGRCHREQFRDEPHLAHWAGATCPSELADQPVININVPAARAFAEWLSERTGRPFRLLSREEWGRLACAGRGGAEWWHRSDWWRQDALAGRIVFDSHGPAPVEHSERNPWGLRDLLGNVYDLCGPDGPLSTDTYACGGSWRTVSGPALLQPRRLKVLECADDVGFRLVSDQALPEVDQHESD